MPVPPCLSPFSSSVVRLYADEYENDEFCGGSLGLAQIADFVCNLSPAEPSPPGLFYFGMRSGQFFPIRSRILRPTKTPLAEAWESEWVTPEPSPMTKSPGCTVSRFSSVATSIL